MFLPLLAALLGGVGLFLVGMILMSDGLKTAVGPGLRHLLQQSTRTRLRAFATGVGLTALVQSSSATTLATIGFVSAGLIPVAASLGVIVGANVGTTSTGWIVALLGFRFSVGAVALPLIGVGALVRLLGRGRAAHLGMALAGFGLIFVGIDVLRDGMGGVAEAVDLSAFSGRTLGGRLVLVGVGAVLTVLLQSSSAAVALTLTALDSGAIGLSQAAFLVIGQNVGTTVTAALAAAGGSVPARRTAAGHILFNAAAGGLAFVLAGPLLGAASAVADDPATQVVVFHTAFNVLGALLFLPLLPQLARAVEALVPERERSLTRALDRSQLDVPSVALLAAEDTMRGIAGRVVRAAASADPAAETEALHQALATTHTFLGSVRMSRDDAEAYARLLSLLHAGDHLGRLLGAVSAGGGGTDPDAAGSLDVAASWLAGGSPAEAPARLAAASERMADRRRAQRADLLRETAAGAVEPAEALARLDALRHADRLLYHTARLVHHLASEGARAFEPQEGAPREV